MSKHVITFGTPPTGVGGDTYRTAFGKCNENFTEVYDKIAYFEGAPKAASSFTIYRDVLSNYRATASLKGALVIHLPKAKNKSTTMLSLRIRGYNYLRDKGEWELKVGGYNCISGWIQCSANLNGPAPFTQVQLGMASDHQVIIIGTTSTVWAYPRFNIEEITAGYSNHESGWNTGLTVEYETNLSAYTGLVTPVLYGWPQVLTAEKLTTARTIGGVSFNGSANINLPGVNTAGNQNTSGNAASATKLQTARTIGGVSFDGTANINLPGVNTAGNQSTSGNAGSATKLATARTIGGVSFDGSANINLPGVNTAGNQSTSGNAATATTLQTARTIAISGAVTGTATSFDGSANITIATTAIDGSKISTGTIPAARIPTLNQATSGNAATATKLQTARTINGVGFDGTANITIADSTKLPLAGGTVTGALTVNGLITAGSNGIKTAKIDSASAVGFLNGGSAQSIHTGGLLVSNAYADSTKIPSNGIYSKGKVQADGGFQGALTGNATSATKLQTPVKINGIDFDGTQNIELPLTGAKKLSIACNLEYPTFQPNGSSRSTFFKTTNVWNEIEYHTPTVSDSITLKSYIGTTILIYTPWLPVVKGSYYTGRVLFVSYTNTSMNTSNSSKYVFTLRFLDLDPKHSDKTPGIFRDATVPLFRILPDIANIPEFSSIVVNNNKVAGDYTFTFTKPFIGEYVAVACATNATAGTESITLTKNAESIRVATYVGGTLTDGLNISLILSGEQEA